jgi:hypothetical protein
VFLVSKTRITTVFDEWSENISLKVN